MASVWKREIELADDARIRVGVEEWKGERRLDVRLFFRTADGWKATKRGVLAPLEKAGEFAEAFDEIERKRMAGEFERRRW